MRRPPRHEKKIVAAEKSLTAKQEELNKAEAAAKTATEQKMAAEKRLARSPTGRAALVTQSSSDQTPGQLLATAISTLDAANVQVEKLKAEACPVTGSRG